MNFNLCSHWPLPVPMNSPAVTLKTKVGSCTAPSLAMRSYWGVQPRLVHNSWRKLMGVFPCKKAIYSRRDKHISIICYILWMIFHFISDQVSVGRLFINMRCFVFMFLPQWTLSFAYAGMHISLRISPMAKVKSICQIASKLPQGGICETRAGPNRPQTRRGMFNSDLAIED